MSKYKVLEVASYLIERSKLTGYEFYINNLKLNKLLYLIEREYIKKYNKKIYIEEISYWRIGAIYEEVYGVYRYEGCLSISEPKEELIASENGIEFVKYKVANLSKKEKELIEEILLQYGSMSEFELTDLSLKHMGYSENS